MDNGSRNGSYTSTMRTQNRSYNRNGSGNRSRNARRRRKRPNRYVRLFLTSCVLILMIFGLVKVIGLGRAPVQDPDYIMPTKITDEQSGNTENGTEYTDAVVVSNPLDENNATVDNSSQTEENVYADPVNEVDAQVEQGTDEIVYMEPTPEPTPEIDEGYFPETIAAEPGNQQPAAYVNNGTGRVATIRFAGDVVADKNILAAAYNSKAKTYSFTQFFSLIETQLANADYTVLNVDGSLGGEKYYKYGYSGYPQFNTPPTLIRDLYNIGVDCLTLANNHCLDGWFDGLKQSIVNCEYVGMDHIGAYASQQAFDTPEIVEVNGIKIGILDYTQSLNSMDSAGVDPNALVYGLRRTRNADYAGDIKKLRNAGADVVIVYIHWGTEYLFSPDKDQISMANTIAKAGADVIVGGHPHVAQAVGWKEVTMDNGETNRCLLIYSLGNFLSEHRNDKKAKTDSGLIVEFTIKENTSTGKFDIVSPKYIPIAVWRIGSEGSYDYRVVSVDEVLKNRPAGMSDSAYNRIREISSEMNSLIDSSVIERISK